MTNANDDSSSFFASTTAREALRRLLEQTERSRQLSLRAQARRLGFLHASHLSMILAGKRKLTTTAVKRIGAKLALDPRQLRFLEFLALAEAAKAPTEQKLYADLLDSLRPLQLSRTVDESEHSSWSDLALEALATTRDFDADPERLSRRLGSLVSPAEVQAALDRLVQLGIVARGANGKLRASEHPVQVRAAHQPDQRARRVLDTRRLDELKDLFLRHPYVKYAFFGVTVSFREEDVLQAIGLIEECQKSLIRLAQKEKAGEAYQVNFIFTRVSLDEERFDPAKDAAVKKRLRKI
jgi:uncharacterized protein (TIGR02147 family)